MLLVVSACASAEVSRQEPEPDASRGTPTPDAAEPPAPSDAPSGGLHGDAPGASGCAFTGVLATWSFSGETGSEISKAVASTAANITATDFTRGSGVTAVNGAGSMNSSNWPTAASADATKYYTVTITPAAGCTMDLTSVAIDAKSSTSGPATAGVGTDADQFAYGTVVSTTAPSTPALSVTGATGAVEIRVFAWSSVGASGTFRVQNTFSVSGALQ